jgi:2-polyprenyl-3-methyl-5-hydroxy-6-metoxy-1,4-benzoquinol methylase
MNMEIFKAAKKEFKSTFIDILKETNNPETDEAALPAYSHKNPFIDYLFWKRLHVACAFANKKKEARRVLDFGCGSGFLSYVLAKNGCEVYSADIEFSPLRLVQERIDFPAGIQFIEGDILGKNLPENHFDLIFAMDVLEHIENTTEYIALFKKLLAPGGIIVVSGPTENWLYKIGRKLAGDRFTGDYHEKNIQTIKQEFKSHLRVRTIKRLIVPFVLFEIFVADNEESTSRKVS